MSGESVWQKTEMSDTGESVCGFDSYPVKDGVSRDGFQELSAV